MALIRSLSMAQEMAKRQKKKKERKKIFLEASL